jgi:hypothetical protein
VRKVETFMDNVVSRPRAVQIEMRPAGQSYRAEAPALPALAAK